MKKLQASPFITSTVGFPPKAGTWDFLQLAYQECVNAILQGMMNQGGYSASAVYLLYGCTTSISGSNTIIAAGAVWSNGEIFLSPQQSVVTPSGSNVITASIGTTQYTTNADPVSFTNGTPENVHNIRQVLFSSSGVSGTGTLNGGASTSNDLANFIPFTTPNGYTNIVNFAEALYASLGTTDTNVVILQGQMVTVQADLGTGAWANITGLANFTSHAQYRVDGQGRVHLRGYIQVTGTPSGGDHFMSLIPAATPAADLIFPVILIDSVPTFYSKSILIYTDGTANISDSAVSLTSNLQIYLDGITFLNS